MVCLTGVFEHYVCSVSGFVRKSSDIAAPAGLRRQPDPRDRRAVWIEITPAGLDIARKAARSYRKRRDRVLDELGESGAERIHQQLDRLLGAMEQDRSRSD